MATRSTLKGSKFLNFFWSNPQTHPTVLCTMRTVNCLQCTWMERKGGRGEGGRQSRRARERGKERKAKRRKKKGKKAGGNRKGGETKKEGRGRKKEGEEQERKYNYLQNTTLYTIYYIMVLKISYSESLHHYTIISLVNNPRAPPGEKRSGEQSRIIGLITLKR